MHTLLAASPRLTRLWLLPAVISVAVGLGAGCTQPVVSSPDAAVDAPTEAAALDALAPDATPPPDAAADAPADAPPAADPQSWHAVAALNVARWNHTATMLRDGRVVVIGGERLDRTPIRDVEIYDPVADTWTLANPLPAARSNHIAVRLPDGRVLVAGGGRSAPIGQPSGLGVVGDALLFDPATNAFTPTGAMAEPRSHFPAVALVDGRVLAVGGGAGTHLRGTVCTGVPMCGPLADALASAEVYDPTTARWTTTMPMSVPRFSFTATLLGNGRVVAAAGVNDDLMSLPTAEVYDPVAGTWHGTMAIPGRPREHHSATLLGNGELLLAGGKEANIGALSTVVRWDPTADTWAPALSLSGPRTAPGLVTLASGRALVVGGYNQFTNEDIDIAAIYDPETNAWTNIARLAAGRLGHTTTVLTDGTVLVVGGLTNSGAVTAECERATP